MTGGNLTAIEGIDDTTALMLVSAIGFDMRRWPTVKHVASWLGLCPHQRVSEGQVLSRRTKVGANRAATALRLAAACLHHRQSALGAFFRRLKARLGPPKAMTATAPKRAWLVYPTLQHGTAYVAQGLAEHQATPLNFLGLASSLTGDIGQAYSGSALSNEILLRGTTHLLSAGAPPGESRPTSSCATEQLTRRPAEPLIEEETIHDRQKRSFG